MMIETHAFGDFVPTNARFLILGSFTGRQAVERSAASDPSYDWFYATKRNQFWPLIEVVYGITLPTKKERQALFTKLGIAMADMVRQCERRDGTNADNNLVNIVYNTDGLERLLSKLELQTVLFSSRYVEKKFKSVFKELMSRYPNIQYATLPSPSPRYATMTKEEKIKRYRELLPTRSF